MYRYGTQDRCRKPMSGAWTALSGCGLSKPCRVGYTLEKAYTRPTLMTPHTVTCTPPRHQTMPVCTPDTHEDSLLLWEHTPAFTISLQVGELPYGSLQFLSAAL